MGHMDVTYALPRGNAYSAGVKPPASMPRTLVFRAAVS